MFSYIWTYFFPEIESPELKKAKNLLLTTITRKRYLKKLKAISTIQKYAFYYIYQEEIFIIKSRYNIKNNHKKYIK